MAVRLPKRYLVTSALPYANGPLHIGHLAGAYLSADVFVRFLRLMKKDVLFVCGSDEHGAAITLRAAKEGISPQEIVDKYHGMFEDTFKKWVFPLTFITGLQVNCTTKLPRISSELWRKKASLPGRNLCSIMMKRRSNSLQIVI